jgi:hypothetical protein
MTFSFSHLSEALQSGRTISAEDVLDARRWAWSDGGISAAEADTIFDLNRLVSAPTSDWTDFFVEAITEYVVGQQEPRGYVDEARADWLIAQIDRDGRVDSHAELELLVKVVESAINVPVRLKAYALRQIETVVTSGEGPTRRGGELRPGVVDEAEVALLRRLLFAGAGDGALIVSRDEADLLWRLKDACADADNAPGWKTLFVQAVGNHLMAYGSYQPLERAEAQRLETFVNDHRSSVAGFLGRMGKGFSAKLLRSGHREQGAAGHEAAVAAAGAVTAEESDWLEGRVQTDGARDAFEEALLAFIAEETTDR